MGPLTRLQAPTLRLAPGNIIPEHRVSFYVNHERLRMALGLMPYFYFLPWQTLPGAFYPRQHSSKDYIGHSNHLVSLKLGELSFLFCPCQSKVGKYIRHKDMIPPKQIDPFALSLANTTLSSTAGHYITQLLFELI